jgi:hypothetical protein
MGAKGPWALVIALKFFLHAFFWRYTLLPGPALAQNGNRGRAGTAHVVPKSHRDSGTERRPVREGRGRGRLRLSCSLAYDEFGNAAPGPAQAMNGYQCKKSPPEQKHVAHDRLTQRSYGRGHWPDPPGGVAGPTARPRQAGSQWPGTDSSVPTALRNGGTGTRYPQKTPKVGGNAEPMTCGVCGEPAAGACTVCGAFWCTRHRKSWFGQALCERCCARTVRFQVACATLLVRVSFAFASWVLVGR